MATHSKLSSPSKSKVGFWRQREEMRSAYLYVLPAGTS
jgi:hypothetical protein